MSGLTKNCFFFWGGAWDEKVAELEDAKARSCSIGRLSFVVGFALNGLGFHCALCFFDKSGFKPKSGFLIAVASKE